MLPAYPSTPAAWSRCAWLLVAFILLAFFAANVEAAQCVVVDSAASDVLRATAAEPCLGFVVLSPTEYSAWVVSPLNLSAEDGVLLSTAILGVWAVAWSFRALARALNTDGEVIED